MPTSTPVIVPEVWSTLTDAQQRQRLARPTLANSATVKTSVEAILQSVKNNGDNAVKAYSRQFDQYATEDNLLDAGAISQLATAIEPDVQRAIDTAYQTLSRFHQAQQPQSCQVETAPGVICESRYTPLNSVGLYVPGGTAVLPSTALMLGVPAQIAGCPNRLLATPANADGSVSPALAYIAKRCGIQRILLCGGAHAIAAMAFGTETIAPVDKLFGPGNAYVTEAKQQISLSAAGVAIDMPAGPSELLVIADESANPAFVAADLLSQAEHGADSQVILLTPSSSVADAVASELERQCVSLPRRSIAAQALANSRLLVTDTLDSAVDIAERYAPEHLSLQIDKAEQWAQRITRAGSIFVGHYTPESGGDYATGTNHVLPTYGFARSYSSLGLSDFYRRFTVQQATQTGLAGLAQAITTLADIEQLEAHKRAVTIRLEETS